MLHRPSRIGLPMAKRAGERHGRAPGTIGTLVLTAALVAAFPRVAAADPAALDQASSDRVLASTVVPDPVRKVGDVRLLARGDAVVVQTLLSTKLLERVIGEIRVKETANWPDDPASVATYVAALEDVARSLARSAAEAPWSDRRQRLLIEFAADADDHAVFVGTFDRSKDGSDPQIRGRQVRARPSLGRPYVLRNIRLILADSFNLPEAGVDRLGDLGPAASEGAAAAESPGDPR